MPDAQSIEIRAAQLRDPHLGEVNAGCVVRAILTLDDVDGPCTWWPGYATMQIDPIVWPVGATRGAPNPVVERLRANGVVPRVIFDQYEDWEVPLADDARALLQRVHDGAAARIRAAVLDGRGALWTGTDGHGMVFLRRLEVEGEELGAGSLLWRVVDDLTGAAGSYSVLLRGLPAGRPGAEEALARVRAAALGTQARRAAETAADARERADRAAFAAAGGHIVALRRCWECGRAWTLGEETVDGDVVRLPRDLFMAAQRALDGRSPDARWRFAEVETIYCGC